MDRQEYLRRRTELMNRLRELNAAEEFNQEAFNEAREAVEALDAQYEAQAQAAADIEALEGRAPSVDSLVDLNRGNENQEEDPEDIHASMEYRRAFMNWATRNVPIPARFLNDDPPTHQTTTTTGAGAVIPTTLVHEIIRKLESRGNVWADCRHTNLQGGVEYPIIDVIPTASWVGEATPSLDQKVDTNGKVTFSYYGIECKIAQSQLSSIVSIPEFEALFTEIATDAIVAKVEIGVFAGTGSGQMKGILNETRIPVGNTITLSSSNIADWTQWKKQVFAKMKKAYRNGKFYMAQGTFDGYIDGMVDDAGQPIGRVNYGITDGETYRFGGKTVEIVEDDVIKPYASASTNDVIAVFGDLKNYCINSNLQMTVVKWTDHDNNKEKIKATMILDGKVLDPNGFLIIKKGS